MENYKLISENLQTNTKIEYRIEHDNTRTIWVYYTPDTNTGIEILLGMLDKETKRGYTFHTYLFTNTRLVIFLPRQDFQRIPCK